MEKTKFNTPFQMSTRDINQAAVAKAARYPVEAVRQAGARRCVFYIDDTPAVRALINRYERRELLEINPKDILNARTELYHQAARALREAA